MHAHKRTLKFRHAPKINVTIKIAKIFVITNFLCKFELNSKTRSSLKAAEHRDASCQMSCMKQLF